jgi:hypothetical protein
MQTDEEVGKISQGAPVVICKTVRWCVTTYLTFNLLARVLESFLKDLVDHSVTDEDGTARASLQAGHM